MGKEVLKGRDEGLVFVDLDVVLELGEMGIVVADFDLLLVPVGLHKVQGFLSTQLLLLKFVEVLGLLEDYLFEFSLSFF